MVSSMTASTVVNSPQKIRVAVASKDKGLTNEHFGHAQEFLIYEIDTQQAQLLENRPVKPYCHGPEESPGDLSESIAALSDCTAVIVAKIGALPESRLKEAGIEVVQVYETIETAVLDFYTQWVEKSIA
jgi:nitrogen fixation protein NifB